uniref:Uncharacterized protein n=1 Tax=Myoviridae sp. ctU4n16 TaxID=2826658 RepID=A0A8S5N5J9_9CAUD|nr:MAG TPA: hypothetical protein [Myoviridae sp. ctU4n16]
MKSIKRSRLLCLSSGRVTCKYTQSFTITCRGNQKQSINE